MTDPALAAYADGRPGVTARFRRHVEDFVVEERLGWEPGGGGEHLYLLIRKRGISTAEAVKRVAACAGVPLRQVSHSGLKDRQGICTQWLSIQLPGREDPDLSPLEGDELTVLRQIRNARRLRVGSHAGNHFRLVLRDVLDPDGQWGHRLERVRREGVPNYFGEQRFGRDNPSQVAAWFRGDFRPRGRTQRGLLLSTARALLFNRLLSHRVAEDNWNRRLTGDVMMLEGSNSHFSSAGEGAERLDERLASGDIHPTGPLWGRGTLPTEAAARQLEQSLREDSPLLCRGLEERGLAMQRRSLRLPVTNLACERDGESTIVLRFTLPTGAYATSVLRELCDYGETGPLIAVAERAGMDDREHSV